MTRGNSPTVIQRISLIRGLKNRSFLKKFLDFTGIKLIFSQPTSERMVRASPMAEKEK
jgi:hypothetical protein